LLDLGQQVGLDRAKLAVCLDSQASKPRVDEGRKEGDALAVSQTPTFYINGKILIGGPPPEAFYQAVEDALRGSK
jgi:predicted DsbA family dithiol-disulfide isomerase